jgi:hypothetical protein
MSKNRRYSCKDVDMLMTSRTIAETFRTNISVLSTVRTDWTSKYADELNNRIRSVMEKSLGIDSKKSLRDSSLALSEIQMPARRDISFFKTQIDQDFKDKPQTKDELLKNLGFTKYLRDVQKGSQEALIQLLNAFRMNMNDSIRKKITENGLNNALIDNIIGYTTTFENANVIQETFKSSSKQVTLEVQDSLNAIYDEIISICKIASKYYRYEPLKAEQFTFQKVLKNLGASQKVTVKTEV